MGVKNWKLTGEINETKVNEIRSKHGLPKPVALYFVSRGIESKDIPGFLNPKLGNLSDPYRFPGIKEACARLWQAISNRESILIHGDYDTDGITASTERHIAKTRRSDNSFFFITCPFLVL